MNGSEERPPPQKKAKLSTDMNQDDVIAVSCHFTSDVVVVLYLQKCKQDCFSRPNFCMVSDHFVEDTCSYKSA